MIADLINRLRTACPPEYPLGMLMAEAADALQAAESALAIAQGNTDAAIEDYNAMKARAEAAEAREKKLGEALEPFAEVGARVGEIYAVGLELCVPADYFRRARTALQETTNA